MVTTAALDHILPCFQPVAMRSPEERIFWIQQDRWINHLKADDALRRLKDVMMFPPRGRMPCLLLTGASGIGKTHIVQKFVRDHPPEFDQITGNTRLRVVAMQMP